MANPRIEEVEDDDEEVGDPDEMDLESFDFARPQHGSLSSVDPSSSRMTPEAVSAMLQPQSQQQAPNSGAGSGGGRPQQMSDRDRQRMAQEQREKSKNYQCIYPVYFDASRSREDGRRVKKEDAVQNPLAREIVEALHHIGGTLGVQLQIVFEPSKCHPKDWANPGRIKVLVKKDGKAISGKIANKSYLFKLISTFLVSHPTTPDSPMKLRLAGLPVPKDNSTQAPAVPRGFKMGTILPLHSPALSGGGVSDNFFKEMMEEMGGQMPEGMANMANMAGMAGAGGGAGGGPKKIRVKQRK